MAATASCSTINLKGSVSIVTEFLDYAINNILYQRGIYPSDTFKPEQNYGLTILVSTDPCLKAYLSAILKQLQQFLLQRKVHRIVLVIIKVDTKETLERWEFTVDTNQAVGDQEKVEVDINVVQTDIRNIIRQITASVTYLPLLDDKVSFDILLYTDKDTDLPSQEWRDSTAHLIPGAEEVELRNFNTKMHNVKVGVAYKTL